MKVPKFPKWGGPFCALFVVNMFSSGTMKVCGIFFESMKAVEGLTGSFAGLIFVAPSAVCHLIAPIVSVLSTRSSHRTLGSVGGVLVGGSFICAGLFATHGLHFLLSSIIAGVGFGFLFLPSVLCLREQAMHHFASLMPLATIGTYAGIAVLPGIVEVFLRKYGLRAAYCMFGALLLNTVPCSLLLRAGVDHCVEKPDAPKNDTSVLEEGRISGQCETTLKQGERSDVDLVRGDNEPGTSFIMDTQKEMESKDNLYCNTRIRVTFQERLSSMITAIKSFVLKFLSQFRLFGDIVFSLYFLTANMRKFPANSWTLFLIPYNNELGLHKSTAVAISAIGGIGGILGRFLAAVSFKASDKVSPLTLFALYYFCDAVVFGLFDSWRNVILMTFCGFASGVLLSAKSGMTSGILCDITTSKTFVQAFGLIDCGCGIYALLTGYISGAIYDVFGSFMVVFRLSALVCAISGVLVVTIILVKKYRESHT